MSHPDEGLIHAWLDGELDPAEAARVEDLVRHDPAWAGAAAEARGLIAATSRIVASLDNVPANVVPAARGRASRRPAQWWALSAAAVLVVVVGSAVVLRRAGPSPARGDVASIDSATPRPVPPVGATAAQATTEPPARPRPAVGAGTRSLPAAPTTLADEGRARDTLAAVRSALTVLTRGAAEPAREQAARVAGAEKAAADVAVRPAVPVGAFQMRAEAPKTTAAGPGDCVEIREPADTSAVAQRRVVRLPARATADTLERLGYVLAKDRTPEGLNARGDSLLGVLTDGRRFVAVRVACPRP